MPQRGPHRPFTEAQDRIAECLRVGMDYKEAAAELHISVHTVSDQVEKMAMLFDAYHERELTKSPNWLKRGGHWTCKDIVVIYACFRAWEATLRRAAEGAKL